MRSFPYFTIVSFLLAGCSGAPDSDLLGPTGPDTNTGDAGADTGSDVVMLPDAGPCNAGSCGLTVPAGFRVVGFADSRKDACPQGATTLDLVADPIAADGACTCACNVTTQPDCTKGGIARGYDFYTSTAACNSSGYALTANGGACGTFGGSTLQLGTHVSSTPPPPTGGACSYDAKGDASKVKAKEVRLCDAPPSCAGSLCSAGRVCVAQDGDVACPKEFATKTLVGAPKVACEACGACTLEAACTGTLSLFSDGACAQGQLDLPADGQCAARPSAANGKLYSSYSYKGTVKAAGCAGTAPASKATVGLEKPTTVCCAN
jgi:hypothetical protein